MKKYVFLIIMLMIFVTLSNWLRPKKEEPKPSRPVLRVGVECDYVPNSWEESRSSEHNIPIANHEGYYADGYDIQIAKLVANQLNVDLKVIKIAWNDLLPSLNSGDIDAIFSSMLDTEERRKIAAFSEPYEVRKTEYAIIVDSVSPYITAKTLRDFRGAKITGEKGTKLDEVIDQIPGVIHFKPADSVQGTIDLVLNGKVDGAVIDTDTGHFYEIMNKNLTLIEFAMSDGFELGFSGVCAAVRKEDKDLLHRIDVALSGIAQSERQNIMDSVNVRMVTGLK